MYILESFINDFGEWLAAISCVIAVLSLILSAASNIKGLKPIFFSLGIASLILLVVIFTVRLSKIFNPDISPTAPMNIAATTPTAESTDEPSFEISTAEMIAWSNQEYNEIKKLKEKRSTDTLDKGTIAHTNYGKIRQIDVKATSSPSVYQPFTNQNAIYYYTEDGELCFILLHYVGTYDDDLRFFVYKGTVVKYIGLDGVESYTVPSEYDEICERGKNVYAAACAALSIQD